MRQFQSTIAIYALLTAACLTLVEGVSRPISFVWFAVVFTGICVWIWWTGEPTLAANPPILASTLLIWFALTISFLSSPNISGLLRLGAFIGISGGLIFGFSNVFNPANVYRAVAWVGASVTLISLPTVFVGELGPLGVWRTATLFGVSYSIPLSVFDNPNTLGLIAAVGATGAAGEVLSARSTVSKVDNSQEIIVDGVIAEVLLVICTLGVVFSTGRGALLALVVGVGILLFIYGFGRDIAAIATVCGGLVLVGAIAIAAHLLPGPEIFQNIDLSGRGVLWRSVIQAVGERPLFGFGPGATDDALSQFVPEDSGYVGVAPHSSYFRMFFIGGIVGGIGYLSLCVSALRRALIDATPQGATTAAMIVAIFVMLIFEGVTVFGLHPVSVMGALTIGFVQLSDRTTRSICLSWDSLPPKIDAAVQNSFLRTIAENSHLFGVVNRRRNR
ncbi:O-antigen ligase family protein [Halococcus dombrowskii]|uniref:O-antigen ligase family protein n=1 Tax=Halococcus dombrowskii TaxID=179637 RepID=A0AAX3AR08_HALDO|nr:O-antigen ligase family protein [Halococcus dombrowskii]UOO94988.1 O-antigen ligase family protein [Halococcus dombrowskii]